MTENHKPKKPTIWARLLRPALVTAIAGLSAIFTTMLSSRAERLKSDNDVKTTELTTDAQFHNLLREETNHLTAIHIKRIEDLESRVTVLNKEVDTWKDKYYSALQANLAQTERMNQLELQVLNLTEKLTHIQEIQDAKVK